MYNPIFRTTKNTVPVVSKKELDIFGERFVADFCPEAMQVPKEIDIDRFVSRYLGMEQEFQCLSHCGCYLGMAVFNDTDKVPVYDPAAGCADYISAKAGTVIIDNSLLEPNQEHRYRFTVGHEGSHHILHTEYFGYNPNQVSLFSADLPPMVQCRVDNRNAKPKPLKEWTESETMEWQANYLSSAILMPKSMVGLAVDNLNEPSYAEMILIISEIFNVSYEAAQYRLKGFGYIPQRVNVASAEIEYISFTGIRPCVHPKVST